ncbi:MAG: thioredoxin fold domain-containing protein [gamma proteobacterium symbiont of Bathyaustriella thionipta]|nr:thioredoxin fold domain-containing protein [gamma proteobacterium symbiont of Bathyaustriella thionipta]
MIIKRLLILWLLAAFSVAAYAQTIDPDFPVFDDQPLPSDGLVKYPDWFNQSFYDLPEDMQTALQAHKKGLIVYFGQQRCAYCKMLMDVNFTMPDIVEYTRRHFDITPIDIWGIDEVTDLQGKQLSEREYAIRENTNFTPSLIFYDAQGRIALRLRGYYPPYQFRAALEYVADDHYKKESFRDYLQLGDGASVFEAGDLNEEDFFQKPPYALDRSKRSAQRPLVVFFEQGDCHACDVLHSLPLQKPAIHQLFSQFDSVQLDRNANTPVLTPAGKATNARQWANDLDIFYTPTLVFFDEQGKEILRVDSVVHFFRLRNVLNYIVNKGYLVEPNYQLWRSSQQAAEPTP